MNKHLIIGSNSFLGVALSKALHKSNETVLGVFHENKNNLFEEIDHIPITKLKNLNSDFNVVYIISAFVPDSKDKDIKQRLIDVNQELVARICHQFKNAKIVYCSSVSVYGATNGILKEKSDWSPESPYAESKRFGEKIVMKHDKYAIVRISSMYGINMKLSTFLPLVIKSAIKNNQIKLYGDGKREQNYIHVNDVANYLIAASRYSVNATFLAVSPISISNLEVAKTIKKVLKDINIIFEGEDNSKSYFYDNSVTNKKLEIRNRKEFKTEVKSIIEWMKKGL
ncbi:NAD-dependent epimerase/dehydratase family protein [Psychroserpens ponticola]|uniref:NAD(P)-dependent oxidoreductase n=1 Tax=Psychroserpens ponticola TaxID=2932268 RepID=A0ABY7RZD0_9FLAO|nr:NAD(P)-dependent oxidoreductase [Psychroserpens ponticola]WCO02516.1 NAD(P)-dependent oxidoreductase [Psychroserpens ponticola]